MSRKIIGTLISVVSAALLLVAFQNCSGNTFGTNGIAVDKVFDSATGYGDGEADPMVEVDTTTGGPGVIVEDNLVQVTGNCHVNGGPLHTDGDVVGVTTCGCVPYDDIIENDIEIGGFKLCALVPNTGANQFSIIQTNIESTEYSVDIPLFTWVPVYIEIPIYVKHVQIISTTQGKITISCTPGDTVEMDIYGSKQTPSGGVVCSITGEVTVDISLVASLINTGQRVVTIMVRTQDGYVRYLYVDVDVTTQVMSCNIGSGEKNTEICVDSAGTVSGTCQANVGGIVKIEVNGVVQQTVACDRNGSFRAENVLLNNHHGENSVKISEFNHLGEEFEPVCTDEEVVEEMPELGDS